MIPPIDPPEPCDDIEKPHPLVAELADEAPSQPLTVRLSDLWTDLLRVDESRNPEASQRFDSALPLLDYMKGIMQWD